MKNETCSKFSRVIQDDGLYFVAIRVSGDWHRISSHELYHRAIEDAELLEEFAVQNMRKMQDACAKVARQISTKREHSRIASVIEMLAYNEDPIET